MMMDFKTAVARLDARLGELEELTSSPKWKQVLADLRKRIKTKWSDTTVPQVGKEIDIYVSCATPQAQDIFIENANRIFGDLVVQGDDFVLKFIVQKYQDKVIIRLRCIKPHSNVGKSQRQVTEEDAAF